MRSGETKIALTCAVNRTWRVRGELGGRARGSLGKGEEARLNKQKHRLSS